MNPVDLTSAAGSHRGVSIRDFPYPFSAMLAICSDLDETLNLEVYLELSRFLNTSETSVYGPGVALEVGNTMYFNMAPGELSYWSVDEAGRDRLRALMRSGHIDCFHSFGDLARRADAQRALDDLVRHDCRLTVWVDHATAPTNFGADIMKGQGDVATSDAYHADLTHSYGVEFVWVGRVTSVVGQNVTPDMAGLWAWQHPRRAADTIARELAKRVLGANGNAKYRVHAENRLMRRVTLRSGHGCWEFMRCNPHWGGVSYGDTGEGLGEALRPSVLAALVEKRGTSIVYTHLGKGRDRARPLSDSTVASLRRLAEAQSEGKILVTTTAKLLRYCRMRDEVQWSASDLAEQGLRIDVTTTRSIAELQGLTFNVPRAADTQLFVNGERCNVVRFPADRDRQASIALPWARLDYPRF